MKIGFDISQVGNKKAGCGFYADGLFRALLYQKSLTEEFTALTSFGDGYFDSTVSASEFMRIGACGKLDTLKDLIDVKNFWNSPDLEANLNYPDILHSNNFFCPKNLKTSKLVYTLYDVSFLREPSWTTEKNRLICYEGVLNASIYADYIVAISEFTRKEFLFFFPHYDPSKISVIYPSSKFELNRVTSRKPKQLSLTKELGFWLSVGTLEPRKNQKKIVEGYKKYLQLGGKNIPLVFAGGSGWLMDDFEEYLCKSNMSDQVICLGYVSDEELAWLYENCFASIYFSLYEGFGLPILEAMKFGVPVISSNTSSMPEVYGQAACALNPEDVDGLALEMIKISVDERLRHRMALDSVVQSNKFCWKISAKTLREVYRKLLCNTS